MRRHNFKNYSLTSSVPQKPPGKFRRLIAMSWGLIRILLTRTFTRGNLRLLVEITVLMGILGFWFELKERTVSRINTSWQLLTDRSPGNSGKVEALEYLNSWQCVLYLNRMDWFTDEPHAGGTSDGLIWGPLDIELPPSQVLIGWIKRNFCFKDPVPLTGIDLSPLEGNKVGTYLKNAQLPKANLREADFRSADLSGANLSGANLIGANLSGANLSYVLLNGAELQGADLTGANLHGANLTEASLLKTDLRGIIFVDSVPSTKDKARIAPIVCSILKTSRNWPWSIRDPEYDCGMVFTLPPKSPPK